MDEKEWLGEDNQLGIDIWNKKYRYNNESFDEWLDRVSGGNEKIKELIVQKKFLFGGRILANRGTNKDGRKVTYSNCYVCTPPKDSIESIFETAGKLARTFSYGGGVGIDLSNLAPRGAKVNNTAMQTSGSVSFSDLYSMVTGLIGQNGRRGALMLSIDCDHPDLEEFISAKTDVKRNTKANMSVRMSDTFMRDARQGYDHTLSFYRPESDETIEKTIDAKKVFKDLCNANYDFGEPGCLFWDTICNNNFVSEYEDFEYAGVNPCAEEPLPAGGSCLLGSINLAEFVYEDAGEKVFDFDGFSKAVHVCVKGLNEVLDEGLELHPLEEQMQAVRDWRQIGLGIMGLGDMLIKMEIPYGSERAIDLCDKIGYSMEYHAVMESQDLGAEFGNFDKFQNGKFEQSNMGSALLNPHEYIHHLRNSQLLTIAPTGTLSTMLGITGGIEPLFATSYTRLTKSLHGEEVEYKVYPPIVEEYLNTHESATEETLPEYFVTAQTVHWKKRIEMQAVWQKHIDASISSTINLPHDFPKEDVYKIYMTAWTLGCKGITIFRDGCKRDSILTPKKKEEPNVIEVKTNPSQIVGVRRTIQTGCGHLHIIMMYDKANNKIDSIWLNHGSEGGCNSFMVGLSRMISLASRRGATVDEIIDQLNSCPACPSYAVRRATKKDTSKGNCCPTAIGKALRGMIDEVMQYDKKTEEKEENEDAVLCPECHTVVAFTNGCMTCPNCGWSKCN